MNLVQMLRTRQPEEEVRSGYPMPFWQNLLGGQSFLAGLNQTWPAKSDEEPISDSYEAYALQLFQQNPIVFAAVKTRMAVFSQARFAYRRWEGSRPQRPFGDSSLRLLERPWPGGTTADLLGKILLRADLAGNSFVWNSGTRLHVWRPDYVTIVLGSQLEPDDPAAAEDAEVVGYVYRPRGDRTKRGRVYGPDEVAHFAPMEDPLAHYRGQSWITPLVRDIQGDSEATEHKLKFFQNGATPNMVVKFDPQMTVDQAREFKELMEAEHGGYSNAYKTLFLGGGADATVVGADFKQLDFSSTIGKGETRIASVGGVPATILGISEGLSGSSLNAGNYSQAKRLFADVTLQDLWTHLSASLGKLVSAPPGAELTVDVRHIPFLQDDLKDTAEIQQKQAAAIRQLVDGGFDPATVVAAVQADDMSLLEHTNMLSVQLQEAGTGEDVEDE